MTGPASNPGGATQAVNEELMPKRTAFIKWAAGRGLDVTEVRDAWGARRFLAPIIDGMWEGWFHSQAVVYPADGTVSPFTVINLGSGQVKMGDSIHDDRLPALWFGKDGLGMGVEETMNRQAAPDETLAVATFANVEGLDVLLEVVQRIRRIAFPSAPVASLVPEGWQLVPKEPTPEIIAGAAIAVWPTASHADIALARLAAPIVLMKMDAPGIAVDALAGMLATMAPAYRAMLAAAPAAGTPP